MSEIIKKDYEIIESCDSPEHGVLIKGKDISLTEEEAKGLLKKKPPIIKLKQATGNTTSENKKAKNQGGADDVSK